MSTGDRIRAFCKQEHMPHSEVSINPPEPYDVCILHTVNIEHDQSTGNGTLLYFHGGGYIYPATVGHARLGVLLAKALGCSQLGILEYTLAPVGRYPTQLAQAVEALRLLLNTHDPSKIAVGGDSAGGNLVLALLAHLRKPHPQIAPVLLQSSLAAALCISPRCTNSTDAPSFKANAGLDIIDAETSKSFVSMWEPVETEVWADAISGGKEFWGQTDSLKADRLFLIAGANECYLDDVRTFAGLVLADGGGGGSNRDEAPARHFVVAKDSIHVQTVIELAAKVTDGIMTTAVLSWASKNRIA